MLMALLHHTYFLRLSEGLYSDCVIDRCFLMGIKKNDTCDDGHKTMHILNIIEMCDLRVNYFLKLY